MLKGEVGIILFLFFLLIVNLVGTIFICGLIHMCCSSEYLQQEDVRGIELR